MKNIIIVLIFSAVCLTTSGQQINQSSNQYRSGDILEKKQVSVEGFDLNGKNGVWSLEDAEISKKTISTEYTAEADTMIMLERGSRTYYHHENSLVSIISSENAQELICYDMPETWLKFPMQVGNSICGYFNGTGKYCDRLFMRRFGTYLTKADAKGKIVLPSGDTLHNVLRLHTERYVSTITAPIDTMKREIPAFTVDSIIRHMATDTMMVKEDIYRWYADGYRYPVLEAKAISYCGKAITEEVYYCSPEMQEMIGLDEENKNTRARLVEENSSGSSKNADTGNFKYEISQDESSGTVTINYSAGSSIKVEAILANSLGHVYCRASKTDGSAITLSYNNLPRGQYIIHITAGKEKFAEKFNVR